MQSDRGEANAALASDREKDSKTSGEDAET